MLADDHETFLATELEILLFASDETPLQEWEYLPPVGPRPHRGFVGLKNAGATCYMNSVLQQVCFTSSCVCGFTREMWKLVLEDLVLQFI